MSITIEQVYDGLVKLTDLCDVNFKAIERRLSNIEEHIVRINHRIAIQDDKIDAFILEVIEMKRDLKHPV